MVCVCKQNTEPLSRYDTKYEFIRYEKHIFAFTLRTAMTNYLYFAHNHRHSLAADVLLQEIFDNSCSNPPPMSDSPAPNAAIAAPVAVEHTGLDGNIQPVVAAAHPPSAINKIKINITKNVSNKIVINSSENTEKQQQQAQQQDQQHLSGNDATSSTEPSGANHAGNENRPSGRADDHNADNRDSAMDAQDSHNDAQLSGEVFGEQQRQPIEPEPEIEFEFKESMRHIRFESMPMVRTGVDASGLCSIM